MATEPFDRVAFDVAEARMRSAPAALTDADLAALGTVDASLALDARDKRDRARQHVPAFELPAWRGREHEPATLGTVQTVIGHVVDALKEFDAEDATKIGARLDAIQGAVDAVANLIAGLEARVAATEDRLAALETAAAPGEAAA